MIVKRVIAILFLLIGILCVGEYAYWYIDSRLYQYHASERFDAERLKPTTPEPVPGKPKGNPETGATIGRISVPRLALTAMVAEGDDDVTLQKAVGHIPGTPLPGHTGNVVIAGHRDTFFRSLKNLQRHDEITFTTLDASYRYVVDEMKIVEPSNVGVMASTGGKTLTIVTCYPFNYIGSAPKRFIVHASQVEVIGKSF